MIENFRSAAKAKRYSRAGFALAKPEHPPGRTDRVSQSLQAFLSSPEHLTLFHYIAFARLLSKQNGAFRD